MAELGGFFSVLFCADVPPVCPFSRGRISPPADRLSIFVCLWYYFSAMASLLCVILLLYCPAINGTLLSKNLKKTSSSIRRNRTHAFWNFQSLKNPLTWYIYESK